MCCRGSSRAPRGATLVRPAVVSTDHRLTRPNDATTYGTKQPADQRSGANFEGSQILQKPARPCFRHRRHLRCDRRFRDPFAADRVGGGSCDSAAAFHSTGPAMAAVAGAGSGGDSGLGSASILAAGGWGNCCPGHSSAEFGTALSEIAMPAIAPTNPKVGVWTGSRPPGTRSCSDLRR
jgi:hypothetical protein